MKKLRAISALALIFAIVISALQVSLVAAPIGPLIWEADVWSTGAPVVSPVLEAGREYLIVAKGWFISTHPVYGWVTFAADAQYYTMEFDGTFSYGPTWTTPLPAPGGHSFLQIEGMDMNWGPFSNTAHEYTINYIGTAAPITFTIVDWIDGTPDRNFCHIHVWIYEGPPAPPEGETAYAYGGDYATCFKHWGFKNWGWSNGPLVPGYYEFDIYAGAAKCNIKKGDFVGTLTIDYDGSTATTTYMIDAGWMMLRTQLYVGSEPLPRDSNGDFTVSPGQYPYIYSPVADPAIDTYAVTGLSGDIYVVAHADVIEA